MLIFNFITRINSWKLTQAVRTFPPNFLLLKYSNVEKKQNSTININGGLSGSSVPGIFQARIMEWFAISYSRGSSQTRNKTPVSYIFCMGRKVLYH